MNRPKPWQKNSERIDDDIKLVDILKMNKQNVTKELEISDSDSDSDTENTVDFIDDNRKEKIVSDSNVEWRILLRNK